jgi:anti-sigma regulatory factor (Ser/Thr protein kinase)
MAGMTPDAGFEDDVAVLIYRHPPEPLRMRVSTQDPSCLAAIRARLREWLPAAGIAAQDGIDVLIAAGEASANAFEHAPTGRQDGHEPVQISIDVGVTQAAVTVTVADTGAWRPPHDGPDTRGHGIPFMHALMDQVNIQTTEHGTTVTMTKEL